MRRLALLPAALLVLLLAACSDSSSDLGPEGRFTALHAVPDLETAGFFVLGANDVLRGRLDFGGGARPLRVAVDTYEFWFELTLPEDTDPTRILEFQQQIAADTDYVFVLTGPALTPALLTWTRPIRSFSDDSIWAAAVGHAAQSIGPVDVYIELPGTDVATATPRAQIDFSGQVSDIDLAPGDYQLTVTERDLPGMVLFASADFTASERSSLLFSILDGAGTGTADLLVRVFGSDSLALLEDLNSPPELRAAHTALSTDPVDIAVGGNFSPPLIENLAFPDLSAYQQAPAGESDLVVTDTGNQGAMLVEGSLDLLYGDRSTLYFVGPPETLEVVSFFDDNRRLARYAQLRFLQMAANDSLLDIYLVEQGEDYTEFLPLIQNLAYKDNSGYLRIIENDYELVITPANDPDTVLAGPLNLDLDVTGIYGFYIVDSIDTDTVDLLTLDQLLP